MKLNYVTNEKGKWFAEIKDCGGRIHTGNKYGWDGMTYDELREKLRSDFGIKLPKIEKMRLYKKMGCREIYKMDTRRRKKVASQEVSA